VKFYEAIAVAVLVILSFTLGILSRTGFIPPQYSIIFIMLLSFSSLAFHAVWKAVERSDISYLERSLLRTGRGLPLYVLKIRMILLEVSVLGIVAILSYALSSGTAFSPMIFVLITALGASIAVSFLMLRVVGSSLASMRKTGAEVELPFLLAFMKTISATHVTFYELLEMISESVAFRWWSQEISFAKKLSRVLNTSLPRTLEVMASYHPSKTASEMLRRLSTAGLTIGEVSDVVDRIFSHIYDKLTQKITTLVDRLDIVFGVMLLGFMFLPVMLVTMAPLRGVTPQGALMLMAVVEAPQAILIYALLSALYPSGFAVRPSKYLTALGVASILAVVITAGIYMRPLLLTAPVQSNIAPGIPDEVFIAVTMAVLIPPTVLSELLYRRMELYSRFVKLATDAAEISASLGENFTTVLQRMAKQYGEDVGKLVDDIMSSYTSSYLRKVVVARAPTVFHASFIEMLEYSILLGAPYTALKKMSETYESLLKTYEKTKTTSRAFEGMFIALAGAMGFFIEYLAKMFSSFSKSVEAAGGGGLAIPFAGFLTMSGGTFLALSVATVVSIVIVGLFVGKMRAGSVLLGFKTSLLLFVVYEVASLITRYLVPSA